MSWPLKLRRKEWLEHRNSGTSEFGDNGALNVVENLLAIVGRIGTARSLPTAGFARRQRVEMGDTKPTEQQQRLDRFFTAQRATENQPNAMDTNEFRLWVTGRSTFFAAGLIRLLIKKPKRA